MYSSYITMSLKSKVLGKGNVTYQNDGRNQQGSQTGKHSGISRKISVQNRCAFHAKIA